ncbi:MAG: NAD(P)-dependent oxidoreductase [Nodosilinea sp.]
MERIAILGLGEMGSRVAQNLLKAGYPVVVYNRTVDKAKPLVSQGAVYTATPKAAAEQADIVIAMVTDDPGSRAVWLDSETGAVLGLKPGAIAIESSTLTVAWTNALAAAIQPLGATFLAAPVVGSRPQAEAGKLIYLAGGSADVLAQVQDVLLAGGGAVIHSIGDPGQAMAMKLVVNGLFGIQIAALAEALGLLTKNGLSIAQAMACLGDLPVISPAAKLAGGLMVAHNHAPLFPVALVEKDFRYLLETATALAAPTPAAKAIHAVYQDAISEGYGADNITGVAQLLI